jgi:hypothetical protein
MNQIAFVARLREGAQDAALALVAAGPPFDPGAAGFERHAVYLSADEVVFVFEGGEVEWHVDQLVDDPFAWELSEALSHWRPLVEDRPRIARAVYLWERSESPAEHPEDAPPGPDDPAAGS